MTQTDDDTIEQELNRQEVTKQVEGEEEKGVKVEEVNVQGVTSCSSTDLNIQEAERCRGPEIKAHEVQRFRGSEVKVSKLQRCRGTEVHEVQRCCKGAELNMQDAGKRKLEYTPIPKVRGGVRWG